MPYTHFLSRSSLIWASRSPVYTLYIICKPYMDWSLVLLQGTFSPYLFHGDPEICFFEVIPRDPGTWWYCWWFRNPAITTCYLWNPMKNWVFSISTSAGFLPSTVSFICASFCWGKSWKVDSKISCSHQSFESRMFNGQGIMNLNEKDGIGILKIRFHLELE